MMGALDSQIVQLSEFRRQVETMNRQNRELNRHNYVLRAENARLRRLASKASQLLERYDPEHPVMDELMNLLETTTP